MTRARPEPMLWLSDSRGIYIPRDFATSFTDRAKAVSGISAETWRDLEAGPDSEWYWEAWESACDHALITDDAGHKFTIYQDGDCWLIPQGMKWCDESGFFIWPDES